MNKIKEEQLSTIKDQQKKLRDLVSEIGMIETKKHQLLHAVAVVNQEVEDFKKELEKEYGSVNINVDTGEYTQLENKEEEEVAVSHV